LALPARNLLEPVGFGHRPVFGRGDEDEGSFVAGADRFLDDVEVFADVVVLGQLLGARRAGLQAQRRAGEDEGGAADQPRREDRAAGAGRGGGAWRRVITADRPVASPRPIFQRLMFGPSSAISAGATIVATETLRMTTTIRVPASETSRAPGRIGTATTIARNS